MGVTPSDASAKREEELMVSPPLQESAIGEREARRQSGNDDRGVQRMNSIRDWATEIVNNDLIYA